MGIGGTSGPLPHLEKIQKSFGRHDVTGVVAHTGPQATAGAQAMGAAAFTMGNHVAFAGNADLRTAAHEAAHALRHGHLARRDLLQTGCNPLQSAILGGWHRTPRAKLRRNLRFL